MRIFKSVMALLLVLSFIGCTQQYTSKETGKELSKELTDVIQVGLIGSSIYNTMKDWKKGLCEVEAISADSCDKFDEYLTMYNGALTIYGETAVAWYKAESNPEINKTIGKEFASAMMWALWERRESLVNAAKHVSKGKIKLPDLQSMDPVLDDYKDKDKDTDDVDAPVINAIGAAPIGIN
jgi:hypothetical protein